MPTTLKEFESVFPTLVEDLKAHCTQYNLPKQALDWFEKVGYTPTKAVATTH
jgi:farnesyl diphosphate synthase